MTFIVILLKIMHLAIAGICGYAFNVIYKDYKKIKEAPDWEETTIFGRLVISTVLMVALVGIGIMGLFLLFIVGSNVTVTSYF